MMLEETNLEAIIQRIEENQHEINVFRKSVTDFFETHPELTCPPPIIHSVKSRTKNSKNLREKIQRKSSPRDPITQENIFNRITDIAGVRILHLYQAQFSQIHSVIAKKIDFGDWILHEQPKAYTWDPESQSFFADMGLAVEVKDTLYTSIHYVIKPREDSPLCCEIQVRTLFEESWGGGNRSPNQLSQTNRQSGMSKSDWCSGTVGWRWKSPCRLNLPSAF